MLKSRSGELKEDNSFNGVKSFTMYDTSVNMPLFKQMVADALRERTAKAKAKYESLADMLDDGEGSLLSDGEGGQ